MQVFDSKLSKTVSLSAILDSFIEDNEQPTTIIAFLRQYEEYLKDIINNSVYADNIFQSTFVNRCYPSEVEFIFKHAKDIDINTISHCLWQLIEENSQYKKDAINALQSVRLAYSDDIALASMHPYNGFDGNVMRSVDNDLAHFENQYQIAAYLNRYFEMDQDGLANIFSNSTKSLYSSRIFQSIVFENCCLQVKYMMLLNITHLSPRICCNFAKQILMSDEPDNVKQLLHQNLINIRTYLLSAQPMLDFVHSAIRKTIDECKTYPQLSIYVQLCGEDMTQDVVFYLLLKNRVSMLKDFAKHDKNKLDEYFKISDYVMSLDDKQVEEE